MFFRKSDGDPSLPKTDRGRGSFDDYGYDLIAKNARVTLRLADSDPHQSELRELEGIDEELITTAISPRSIEDERIDASIAVRLFLGTRVSPVVGVIPRGLESIVDETLRRLDDRGDKPRIPARVVATRQGYRVDLLMGSVR